MTRPRTYVDDSNRGDRATTEWRVENEKGTYIATAFAIGERHFLTNAHVFVCGDETVVGSFKPLHPARNTTSPRNPVSMDSFESGVKTRWPPGAEKPLSVLP